MARYRIAVIPGDGIGTEVIEQSLITLRVLGEQFGISWDFTCFPWGSDNYFRHGELMPSDGLDTLASHDAILFGAVGHPDIDDHITLNSLLLPIRQGFDQYVCVRPNKHYSGIKSPLSGKTSGEIDIVIIRENTEGEYANIGGLHYQGLPQEIAVQTSLFTRQGCERIMRYAFELSRKRPFPQKVTSVTKSNAMGYGMVLWDTVFRQVSQDYPDILTESLLVDAACMDFIRRPQEFDVVVASNLFGDILSDIAAIITGSMGLAASGNINPERIYPSMFEPVHGSAPDIAGKNICNPIAAILSGAMMTRHLGEPGAALALEKAVVGVIDKGTIVTPDLGGSSTTEDVGNAVVQALNSR